MRKNLKIILLSDANAEKKFFRRRNHEFDESESTRLLQNDKLIALALSKLILHRFAFY